VTWLDGFQRVVFDHSKGEVFAQEVRAVCFHTTEGSTAQGAFSVYASQIACPHMTVQYNNNTRYQHVPLTASAYALQRGDRNHRCAVQTNKSGIIQVELVGFAAETPYWTEEQLQWVGTQVLAPILDAHPQIPYVVYDGPRMNEAQWSAWEGGLCGHADVCCQPAGHWDPGDLDLNKILDYAIGVDDMPSAEEIAEAIMNEPVPLHNYETGGGETATVRTTLAYIHGELNQLRVLASGGTPKG